MLHVVRYMLRELSKSKIFLLCCGFFIFGIGITSFLPNEWMEKGLLWFSSLMLSVIVLITNWKNKKARIIAWWAIFLFGGIWRYSIDLPAQTPDKIWFYNGQTQTVIGKVINEPDQRKTNQKLEIEIIQIKDVEKEMFGKILVTTDLYPEYNYGDFLKLTCDLERAENFQGFAYDRFLAQFDIYSVCYYPRIEKIENSEYKLTISERFYQQIFFLKNSIRNKINQSMYEPNSSLISAMVLGDKKGIDNEQKNSFSRAGISHITAISGMHIGIISVLLLNLFIGIGLHRKRASWLVVVFIILYIIIIGMPASAMRAGLMGALVLWAINLGRLNKLTNVLLLAATVLLFVNPKLLRDDIGFQLSFLAVWGISIFYPKLKKHFSRIQDKLLPNSKILKAIFDILNVTISAQILTLPLLAYNFSQISLVSPLTNLLVIWTLPLIMIASFLAIGLSFIFPSLGALFFLPSSLLAGYIIKVSKVLGNFRFGVMEIDYLWLGWTVIYYLLILVFIKRRKKPLHAQ